MTFSTLQINKLNAREINTKFPLLRQPIRHKKEDLLINIGFQTTRPFLIRQYFIQKENNIGDTLPGHRKNMMYFISQNRE